MRGGLIYLEENHGRDLLGGELLGLVEVLDLNLGVAAIVDNLEGPRLDVLLDGGVIEAATDQTPRDEISQIQVQMEGS